MMRSDIHSNIKVIQGEELRRMQLLLLENLVEFDRVCRKNDIKYVIGFGTLLGAVRHKGFISWDDDADICMTREEYEKFKKVRNQLNHEICFFQDNGTEKEYPWGYGKVRHSNTTYVRLGQEHLKHRTGLMIDIFPMDDIPKTLTGMKIFEKIGFILRKMTYSHVACKSAPSVIERFIYGALALIPTRVTHRFSRLLQNKENNNTVNRAHMIFFSPDGMKVEANSPSERYGWAKKWLTELSEYEFEGHKFLGPKDFDSCLKWSYGKDYMTPPPNNERVSAAPCSSYKF